MVPPIAKHLPDGKKGKQRQIYTRSNESSLRTGKIRHNDITSLDADNGKKHRATSTRNIPINFTSTFSSDSDEQMTDNNPNHHTNDNDDESEDNIDHNRKLTNNASPANSHKRRDSRYSSGNNESRGGATDKGKETMKEREVIKPSTLNSRLKDTHQFVKENGDLGEGSPITLEGDPSSNWELLSRMKHLENRMRKMEDKVDKQNVAVLHNGNKRLPKLFELDVNQLCQIGITAREKLWQFVKYFDHQCISKEGARIITLCCKEAGIKGDEANQHTINAVVTQAIRRHLGARRAHVAASIREKAIGMFL
jgi:hypothetical protein